MNDRQIRSYHKAFRGELTIYSFGQNLRPWRPIPARGIFWMGSLVFMTFVALHVFQIHLPLFSFSWGVAYLGLPFGLGWLLTVAKVEGRRVHVAAGAWIHHALRGRESVGGYRRLVTPASPRQGSIGVREAYVPDDRRLRPRHAVLVLPVLIFGIALLLVLSALAPRRNPRLVSTNVSSAAPVLVPPVLPPSPISPVIRTTRYVVPRKSRRISSQPSHPARPVQVSASRHTAAARPARLRTVPVVSHPSAPPAHVAAPSRVTVPRVIQAAQPKGPPVSIPAPSHPSCYPGQLGC